MLLLMGLLGACAHLPSAGSTVKVPEEAVLGWRLVPGQELSYAHSVRLLRGNDEVGRTEHWTYLVREVNEQGVALLEGRLTGFGAVLRLDDVVVPDVELLLAQTKERERLQEARVWVSLGMDGRLHGVDGLPWEDTLSHHLLGIYFPSDALVVGERWSDPGAISPYVQLVAPQVAILPTAHQQLISIEAEEGVVFAEIESEGAVILGGEEVPRLILRGRAQWDLVSGALETRRLELSLSQYDEPFGGQLLFETQRQH
jgi:hypothetical protein